MAKEKEETHNKTDYHKTMDLFYEVGIDFKVVWAAGGIEHGAIIILNGTILTFDDDLEFCEQEAYQINDGNVSVD